MKAVLVTYTHIPPVWIAPIWLGATAATFALLVYIGNRVKLRPVQEKGSQSIIGLPIAQAAAEVEMYYHRIDPRFTGEVEGALRQTAAKLPAPEKETYLFHALTVAVIYVQLELVWHNIFGSQIKALQRLNHDHLKREVIFPYYAAAANANAKTYADYSFDRWLGFMRSHTLIREDGGLISITIKGRDFLKYLIDDAKPIADKTL